MQMARQPTAPLDLDLLILCHRLRLCDLPAGPRAGEVEAIFNGGRSENFLGLKRGAIMKEVGVWQFGMGGLIRIWGTCFSIV